MQKNSQKCTFLSMDLDLWHDFCTIIYVELKNKNLYYYEYR